MYGSDKMIKKIVLCIGILLCLCSCGKDYVYRIDGKLTNLTDSIVYAVFEREDYKIVDTILTTKPGQFEIIQNEEGFHSVTLFFENKTYWVTAYLNPGDHVTITGDVTYPLLLQVRGGNTNDRLSAFRKANAEEFKELTDLTNILNTRNQDSTEETETASRIAHLKLSLSERAMEYIKEHPDEEASVVLIQTFFALPDDTRRMDELLALLSPDLKSSYLVRELEQFSARAKRTALGAEAPGFSVKNIYGENVSLNTFSDKYLLLAFTAPWCDMCQTEDLYLDQISTIYPKEQVDILLISLDDDQGEVRSVLEEDSIKWNLVTDSAGQATMLLDLYNVSALPRCFLIDEDGKILMKMENGIEIKQTLEKLMAEEDE